MIYKLLSLALLIGQVLSQSIDLRTGVRVTHAWMETGFVYVNDAEWVDVSSLGQNWVQPVILTALPDLGGSLYTNGLPTATRIRNIVVEGQVSFQVKLFQPNDSYCSKNWHVPQYITPDVEIGWAIAEYGAYNVSSKYVFIIGTGDVNRTFDKLDFHHDEFHQLAYPDGCSADTCHFPASYGLAELGAISTIQSYVHPEYLFLRIQYIARRFLRMVLTPHDSSDVDYYKRFKVPETVGFMAFRTGLALDCVERMTFETRRFTNVTSAKLHFDYHFTYLNTPGVFGIILTQNSLVDATSLRVFARTTSEAYVITQEDQCDEFDPIHTTNETASVLVVGETTEGTEICDVIYATPSSAPTVAPSTPGCTYNFLLYDLFGDGWQNINLAIDTDGNIANYQVQCACDMISVFSQSCILDISMTSNGEPIAYWEPLWATTVAGVTYVGDYDTTMHIDHNTVTVTNGPDTDPNSAGNTCKPCTPPNDDPDVPDPGPNPPNPNPRPNRPDRPNRGNGGGRGDDKPNRGNGDGRGDDKPNRGNGDGKGDDKPADDKPIGGGVGDGDGPGAGAGAGDDCNGKGKNQDEKKKCDDDKKRKLGAGDDGNHGTGFAPFTIYDQFGNGWYKGQGYSSGVCDSELCPNNDDTCVADTIDLPDILTYPKWYVMNAARTQLVDFGSMCENPKGIEGCMIELPDGRYVFRVAGYNLEGDVASWRFCNIYGVNHQELQFSMVNGHCVPHALLAAEDYCTGFKTLVTLSGAISITGVTDANIDDYDTNAIYLQLLAMFPNTVAVEIISENRVNDILTVNFVVTVSPEDYGLDGSISTNVDTVLNTVYAAAQSESQSNFLSGLSATILSSPTGAKDPLAHVSGATLTSLEVIQVQYVKKDDNTILHPLDVISSSSSKGESVHNGISIMTVVALVCGAIFMAAATVFALLRNRASTHSPLSDKSSHLDTSVNKFSSGTSLDIEK